jgi:hypothetical protein
LKDEIYIKWPADQNPQIDENHFAAKNPYLLGSFKKKQKFTKIGFFISY